MTLFPFCQASRVSLVALFPDLPILSCCPIEFFCFGSCCSLYPATSGLFIVPMFLCSIRPCMWPFACSSGSLPCSFGAVSPAPLPWTVSGSRCSPPSPHSRPGQNLLLLWVRRDGWTSLTIWLFSVPGPQYLYDSVILDSHSVAIKALKTGRWDRGGQALPINLFLPLSSCETLGKLLNLFQPQFPDLQNGDNNSYVIGELLHLIKKYI